MSLSSPQIMGLLAVVFVLFVFWLAFFWNPPAHCARCGSTEHVNDMDIGGGYMLCEACTNAVMGPSDRRRRFTQMRVNSDTGEPEYRQLTPEQVELYYDEYIQALHERHPNGPPSSA